MLAEFLLPAPRVLVSGRQGNPMPKDAPETHIQRIVGTADLPASETSSAIAVETATHNLVFRAGGSTRKVIDNASDQTVAGAKTFTGTTTLSGTTNFSGPTAFTGAQTGRRRVVVVGVAAVTITAADSGTVYIATKATQSPDQIFTLPAAVTPGLEYTFVCGHGTGEITVAVATGDNIIGKTQPSETGGALATTATTGILINTVATNVIGDSCTLVSDGITSWYMIAEIGVWAAA